MVQDQVMIVMINYFIFQQIVILALVLDGITLVVDLVHIIK